MRPILFLAAAVAIFSTAYLMSSPQLLEQEDLSISKDFIDFITTYARQYVDQAEFARRYENFRSSILKIKLHNSKKSTFEMGVNQFADWSEEEYLNFLTYTPSNEVQIPELVSDEVVGDAEPIDWRDIEIDGKRVNAVHEVRDQGSCGSCWAFSAIAAIESAEFIRNGGKGKIPTYSEQQLVDCDKTCYGCNGGLMKNAFKHLSNNYITEDSKYPYTAKNGNCDYSEDKATKIKVDKQKPAPKNDEGMKDALKDRPVAIAVQAGQDNFRYYTKGIMECLKTVRLDHGILLVGWGIGEAEGEEGKEYYIVKNSWGPRWGEAGYGRILIDGVSCGLLQDADQVWTKQA